MINAGIVGLGWWGKTLVESLADGGDLMRFVAMTTRTVSPDVEAFAKQHKLRLLDSYEAVLRDRSIDAVVLATPPSGHVKQIIAAAAAGKHVFCEKPFAYTKKDAEMAVDAVLKSARTLGLGYNRRFHPEMIKLRERIRSGELGVIQHIECNMAHPNALYFKPAAWRAAKTEAPVGGLASLGVHAVDAFIDLCGDYDRVYCQSFARVVQGEIDDTSSMLFRMKAGMSAYLSTITTSGPGFSFQVFGSKGWLRLEGVTHVAGASSEERRTQLFGACKYQPLKGPLQVWEAEKLDVTRACFEAFARAAEGGPPFPITPEQMIHGASASEAIIRSAASGKVEKVL
ncbi:MAG TPA: Gfo/Idh/MocA family oxidoreductase [Burkholderiales bacterium]|nr:Gfo/Idh/MocA family oxidoreductase [Burkholderiales bacterium]